MKIIATGKSDIGRVRRNNEDSFLVDDLLGLYAVADGMGGHQGGEVASSMAIQALPRIIQQQLYGDSQARDSAPPSGTISAALVRAVSSVNTLILDAAARDPHLSGMGTTLTAMLFAGESAFVAHAGDSRAYLLRDGSLNQLTEDHSVVAEYIRAGLLTPEQARASSYRHVITRALGIDRELVAYQQAFEVRRGDTFLLCTDGLTEMLDDAEIRRILSDASPQDSAEGLVREANSRGGVDNITVVVIQSAGD